MRKRPEFADYEAFVNYFKGSKVRDPGRGKPFRTWGRVKQDGDAFNIFIDAKPLLPLCRITPDNICTWTADRATLLSFKNTLTMATADAIPFAFLRMGKGRYNVACYDPAFIYSTSHDPNYNPWDVCRKEGVEYYQGLQFDMKTTKCLNPIVTQTNEAQRTEWLRALRKFKRAVKTRAKVGAIDALIRGMTEQGVFNLLRKEKPDWAAQAWVDKLYNAIIDPTKIDNTLLQGIARTCAHGWWVQTPPSTQEFLKTFDDICNELSVPLRKKFGVLVEVPGV